MADKEVSPFKYLPYVTFREGWSQIKATFFVWIILSAVGMGLTALAGAGVNATETYWSVIPKPLLVIAGFAAFSWVVRGEELRLALPQTFKGWLFLNLGLVCIVFAGSVLPGWTLVPLYFGIICFFAVLDELAAIGKNNYERLSEQGNVV